MLIQSLRLYFVIDLEKYLLINRIVSSRATTLCDHVLAEYYFRAKETKHHKAREDRACVVGDTKV